LSKNPVSPIFTWYHLRGFLGAGVIIRDGLNVRGLNTAATLWCSNGDQRDDRQMESAVSRLSLEPSVTSVGWHISAPEAANGAQA
jgi:uncharacterized membrane protein YhiD involved in acid resistance